MTNTTVVPVVAVAAVDASLVVAVLVDVVLVVVVVVVAPQNRNVTLQASIRNLFEFLLAVMKCAS